MPSQVVVCTNCQAKLKVAEVKPGARLRCPKCQKVFQVPRKDDPEEVEEVEERVRPPRRAAPPPPPPRAVSRRRAPEPEEEEEEDFEPPRSSRRRPADEEEEEDFDQRDDFEDEDEEDDEPRSRRRSRSGRAPVRRRRRGASGDTSIMGWLKHAAAHYTAVLLPMIGFWLIVLGCVGAGMYLSVYLMINVDRILGFILYLAVALTMVPLFAGFSVVALAQLKGNRWEFSDFFRGFEWFGPLLLNGFLLSLVMIGAGIPIFIVVGILSAGIQSASFSMVLFSLACALIMCLMVWLGCFCQQFIIDGNCGPMQAISANWDVSNGNKLNLVLSFLVLGLIVYVPMFIIGFVMSLLVGYSLFSLDLDQLYLMLALSVLVPMAIMSVVMPFVILAWNAGYMLVAAGETPVTPKPRPRFDEEEDDFGDDEEEDDRPRRRSRR